MLPGWMIETEPPRLPETGRHNGKYGGKFLTRSIREMQNALHDEMTMESYAARDGFLQNTEPAMKIVVMLVLVIMVGFLANPYGFLGIWMISVAAMCASRLPVIKFQRRIWGIIPLITLLISLPGMLNIFNPGEVLLKLAVLGNGHALFGWHVPAEIYFTKQGVTAGVRLCARTGLSLSFAVLLVMTTPASALFNGLRQLRVPSLFVMIIEMSYRYLFLLIKISIEIFEARSQRIVGKVSFVNKQSILGTAVAALFFRSVELADEVFCAMIARCYTDGGGSLNRIKFGRNEFVAAGAAVLTIITIMGEHWIG